MTQFDRNLKLSLFLLRLGVFIVMAMWTVDKFLNPEHTARIFENFYFISGLPQLGSYILGAVQSAIVLAFLFGLKKRISYGFVLIMHTVSTLSSYSRYLDPWTGPNLLFFAAWPMLASLIALYLLRDEDTILAFEKRTTLFRL